MLKRERTTRPPWALCPRSDIGHPLTAESWNVTKDLDCDQRSQLFLNVGTQQFPLFLMAEEGTAAASSGKDLIANAHIKAGEV